MTRKEIEEANIILSRLDNRQTVNGAIFSYHYKKATGSNFKHTRCIPCIQAAMKEMRFIFSRPNFCSDCPQVATAPEPIIESIPTEWVVTIPEKKPRKDAKKKNS